MSNLYGWLSAEELPSSPSAKIDDIYNNRVVLAKLFGLDKGIFGVDSPLTGVEAEALVHKGFPDLKDSPLLVFPGSGVPSFISRADFATALARILGYKAGDAEHAPRFADIPPESKLFGPLSFLSEKGVLERVGAAGIFMPDSFLTRGAAVDMLMRSITLPRSGI
jgi:hypothetical protein